MSLLLAVVGILARVTVSRCSLGLLMLFFLLLLLRLFFLLAGLGGFRPMKSIVNRYEDLVLEP